MAQFLQVFFSSPSVWFQLWATLCAPTFAPPTPVPGILSFSLLPCDLLSPFEKELRCYPLLEPSPTSLETLVPTAIPTISMIPFATSFLQLSVCGCIIPHSVIREAMSYCVFSHVTHSSCLLASCLSIAG